MKRLTSIRKKPPDGGLPVLQVYNNLLKLGLQKEVSGTKLCQIAESLRGKKLSDYKAQKASKILLQKLNHLAQGKQTLLKKCSSLLYASICRLIYR